MLDKPYLGRHVGYPGVAIDAAFVDLPGGVCSSSSTTRSRGQATDPDATANPGNVHLCLAVGRYRCGLETAPSRSAPARSCRKGPIDVTHGPNTGARAAYLRIHDGITLELFQPAPRPPAEGMS